MSPLGEALSSAYRELYKEVDMTVTITLDQEDILKLITEWVQKEQNIPEETTVSITLNADRIKAGTTVAKFSADISYPK